MTESYVERFAREQKEKTESGRKEHSEAIQSRAEQKAQKSVKKVGKNSVYGEMQKKEVKDDDKNTKDGEAEDNKLK